MYELGKTVWSDDHPELYGEALDFDALANVESNELLLYDDDATEPFGGVICKLAVYTEHGIMLDTGGEKLTAVDRDELEEEAEIWRLKTDGLPETDGIEALGLDEKTLNRLHKNCPEINTISKLIGTMYLPNAFEKISTPDMKRIESALKKNGIIKYMRGDWVDESDIDPEPLTWNELHDYIGKLLVHDCSTESQRCLKAVWIYKIEDSGDTCLSFLDGGTSFSNTRKGYINGDKNPITPNLAHEGQFFVLKNQRLDINRESTDEMPMKETEMKPDENASETVPMLTEQQQAEALHKQIIGYGEVIYQSLYGMCTAIKQMRDSKLYRALGFDTFEAYTEEKLSMKHSQAYRYIAIAEKFAEDSFPSMGKIGMTKLTLLTALTDDQREEIAQTVDLESTTVRELREQIAALKEESELDRKERDNANEAAQRWKNTAQSAQADNQRLEDQVQSLTDQVKEAEEAKERNRLTLRGIIDKKVELVHQLEAQIKELESKPQDVAVVDRTEEVNALKTEIESLKQQLAEKPDTQLALGVEPIFQTDSKALFKPYLTAAADAVNRLAEFIAQHQSDANYDFFIEKMHAAFALADQKIQAMKG